MSDGAMITITLQEYHALLQAAQTLAEWETELSEYGTASWEKANSEYLVESHDD